MGNYETVEKLTQIISTQSGIIRQLYSVVEQLGATTSLDDDIASVLHEADRAVNEKVEL